MITSTGSAVGIGISTPTSGATLDVYNATQGNLFISSASTNDSCLRFYSGGNELVTLRSTGTGALRIETGTGSPAERIRVTATGLVGIGTTTPGTLLQIANSSTTYGAAFSILNTSNSKQWNFTVVGSGVTDRNGNLEINNNASDILFIKQTGEVVVKQRYLTVATETNNEIGVWVKGIGTHSTGYASIQSFATGVTYDTKLVFQENGGRVLIGQTTPNIAANGWNLQSDGGGHASFAINNNEAFIYNNRNTGTTYEIDFRTNSVERGKISVTDSGVSYITTPSDINLSLIHI